MVRLSVTPRRPGDFVMVRLVQVILAAIAANTPAPIIAKAGQMAPRLVRVGFGGGHARVFSRPPSRTHGPM